MKKTLTKLALLGTGLALGGLASSGCVGEQLAGEIGLGLAVGAAEQKIAHEVNSKQTNVNVYNQGNGQEIPLTMVREYYIDENFLDGTEKDKKEARSIYKALVLETLYLKMKTRKEFYDKLKTIDLSYCSEGFKESFEKYIEECKKSTPNVVKSWGKVMQEAIKEGVRPKK